MFDFFRRKGPKAPPEPRPEDGTPPAPSPETPSSQTDADGPKRRGFLSKLFGRKPKEDPVAQEAQETGAPSGPADARAVHDGAAPEGAGAAAGTEAAPETWEPYGVLTEAGAEADARAAAALAEEEARARAEAEARARAEAEEERRLEDEASRAAEAKAEADARTAAALAEEEARARAEAEARAKAEAEEERRLADEARRAAEAKAEAYALAKAEAEARAKEEADVRARAEKEARARAEAEARAKAEAEEERRLADEARRAAEAKAEEERRLADEARRAAEAKAEADARTAAALAEEESRARAEAEAGAKADEELRLSDEARRDEERKAEADARAGAEAEAAAGSPEEERLRTEAEERAGAGEVDGAAEPEKKGWFSRLRSRLAKTRDVIAGRIEDVVKGKRAIDQEVLDDLEEILYSADLGPATAEELLEKVKARVARKELADAEALKSALRDAVLELMDVPQADLVPETGPRVILVVGVNGVGKTTTIAKLARTFIATGQTVLLAAGDTFRAAAVEQLGIWAERLGCGFVSQPKGSDAAAVVFDALNAAKARDTDVVIIDTAGRLHTKANLMEELKKIKRVAGKAVPGAPHETILVLDAHTGRNADSQARTFHSEIGVDSIIVTKLDGTSKGGMVVSVIHEHRIPVIFIGIGESYEDLRPFDPEAYADALMGIDREEADPDGRAEAGA
ncbi:MAG: signal recognition particle-docking protein FtsY [Deltaproteobacteria bacterium]|jgi:fused signal recognition particle receptor|nr:signal recognition particle-docking protein FtsY [Deltaproteobacteria bacterium]